MKSKLIIVLSLLISNLCLSQDKTFNLVMSVDGKIVTGEITGFYIAYENFQGQRQLYNAIYIPGNLKISENEFSKMQSDNVKTLQLIFKYNEFIDEKHFIHSYEIDLNFDLLNDSYLALSIYNTDKKCYKKIFYPLPGKHYNFELKSPRYTTGQILTKGKRSKLCKCGC